MESKQKKDLDGPIQEPFEAYLAREALNASAIKAILRSPKHYEYEFLEEHEDQEETEAQRLGTLIHLAVLEAERFQDCFKVMPEFWGKTKQGKKTNSLNCIEVKQQREAWLAERQPHEIVVSESDLTLLLGVMNSIQTYPGGKAMALLRGGYRENTLVFKRDGFECKARPDLLKTEGLIVDVKTVQDASAPAFQRHIRDYRHDVQMAWYLRAADEVFGTGQRQYAYLVVEKKPPYCVAIYHADPIMREYGEISIERAIKTLKECHEAGEFPFQRRVETVSLHPYFALDIEQGVVQ